ncbi:MAG: ABC transporter permease [Candidatus Schekmanbacteria bacterium]|nr:ABC transporter permease [Candidatus Schekmanbacteria bacterium]
MPTLTPESSSAKAPVQADAAGRLAVPAVARAGASLWRDAWRRLLRNRAAVFGAVVIAFLIAICLATPYLAPYSDEEQDFAAQFQPPSAKHLFGTDIKGRDLLTRVMYGGRISLAVGVVATFVSMLIGIAWGSVAGYVGGRTDEVMMRIVDILYSIPFIFFVILLMLYLGRSLVNIFLALGAVQWLTMSRIVRGQILSLKHKEFVEASRALGAGPARVLTSHLIPNLLGPVIVYATLTVPMVMLEEAFLSFLGLGVQAPRTSWGSLAADGAANINPVRIYWWLIVFPGMALAATLFSLNFLGDGLRDALDPQLKDKA